MLNKLCGMPHETGGKSTLQHARARSETSMKTAQAVEISERALAFLAERPPDLQRFLTASGLDAAEFLAKSEDPSILAAVLGFVAGEESLAKDFSEAEGLKPGVLLSAYARLDPHGSSAW
jgi:hypothetical protein